MPVANEETADRRNGIGGEADGVTSISDEFIPLDGTAAHRPM